MPSEVQILVLQQLLILHFGDLVRGRRRSVLSSLLARNIEPKLFVGVLSLADALTVSQDYISYAWMDEAKPFLPPRIVRQHCPPRDISSMSMERVALIA